MGDEPNFDSLKSFLKRVPAIGKEMDAGRAPNGNWWARFSIDPRHPLAWCVVQEFACVLNNQSSQERLPTTFVPHSPTPYLCGGPRACLAWVIESTDSQFKPSVCMRWLEALLPQPVDDPLAWEVE